jgi:hypothetical protein
VLLIIYYLLSTWRLDLNFKNIKKKIFIFNAKDYELLCIPGIKRNKYKIYFGSLTTNQQLEKIQ